MKNRKSHTTAVPASVGAADSVPGQTAPKPPSTYVARKLGRGRGYRPQRAQRQIALKAVTELRGPMPYETLFGAAVPAKGDVADALESASGWSARAQEAEAWSAYVRQQEATAWEHAGGLLDALKVPFEFAQSRDVTVASQYPSTSRFFALKHASAARAAATRHAKRTAKAQPATVVATQATTTTKSS